MSGSMAFSMAWGCRSSRASALDQVASTSCHRGLQLSPYLETQWSRQHFLAICSLLIFPKNRVGWLLQLAYGSEPLRPVI